MVDPTRRIPCTIITGFLGAGKTTIIRNLLENPGNRRFAVLVNEFGDVGIDGDVLKGCGIAGCPEENVVELANGCICCTVADDFQPALETILAREPTVDHILIETSGLALPKPLVQAFQWPQIRARVTVDGVVAVADGEAIAQGRVAHDMQALAAQRAADETLDHDDPVEELFKDQIACADLVLLTKSDLITADQQEIAKAQIAKNLGRAVKIIPLVAGAISPDVLLGLAVNSHAEMVAHPSDHDEGQAQDQRDQHHHHDDHHHHHDHNHDEFESFVVDLDTITDVDVFVTQIEAAAAMPDVLRIKGFADIAGKPMRLQIQAVGARVQTHFDRAWKPDEKRATRLVVIGLHDLNKSEITHCLAQGNG